MSQSLSPQNLPPLLNGNRTKDVLTLLREPLTIAVFASIGAHSLLAAVLPLIPSEPPPEEVRQVRVIELSPMERLRLPQAGAAPNNSFLFPQSSATSPYVLPPIGNTTPPPNSPSAGGNAPSDSSTNDLTNQEFWDEIRRQVAAAEKQQALEAARQREIELARQREAEAAKQREAEQQNQSSSPDEPPPPENQTASNQQSDNSQTSAGQGQKFDPNGILNEARSRNQQRQSPNQQGTQVAQGQAPEGLKSWINQVAKAENINSSELYKLLKNEEDAILTVPCPTTNCAAKLDSGGNPLIYIAITREGKILDGTLSINTGDEVMNEAARKKALETVKSELKATGNYQIRSFLIQFQEQPQS